MEPQKTKAVVVYSGGMDSYTVLHRALAEGREVYPINFNYGQRHMLETVFALDVCLGLGLDLKQVDISCLNTLIDNSALTGDIDVPKGHYEDENMKQTVVPNRNMMLLSIAAAYAVNIGATELWYGAHSGDHAIYPDCRPEFVDAMRGVLDIANFEPVSLVVPYLHGNKETILHYGLEIGLDYSNTWTCYDPQGSLTSMQDGATMSYKACGKCGSCTERLEAFAALGKKDPVEYI